MTPRLAWIWTVPSFPAGMNGMRLDRLE